MVRLFLKASAVAIVAVTLSASSALALSSTQVNGVGLTHLGNTLGLNAKADLSGHYTYVSHDSDFMVRCFSYTWYRTLTDASGNPEVVIRGTCTDQGGQTIYMETYFIDRGEPGVGGPGEGDVARVFFTYHASYADDPDADPGLFLSDYSLISAGNVQILPAQISR